jgi:hypothetical protein
MFLRPPLIWISALLLLTEARADNYNVITTSDAGPGSLREAILDANAHPNLDDNTPDTLSFAIPGAGVQKITPLTELPEISDPAVLDGYTQPGASPNTLTVGTNALILIELNGNGASFTGLAVGAGNSVVRGIAINNFSAGSATGLVLRTKAGNKIEGCFIGTNAAGTAAANNKDGILIANSAQNIIGGPAPSARNLILGNTNPAINTQFAPPGSVSGLIIQGNYIGTDVTGTKILGTGGIRLVASNNLIGGTVAGAGNVISIQNAAGVLAESGANGNTIQGNFVGLGADGVTKLGNGFPNGYSIFLNHSNNNLVGGSSAAARNVTGKIAISGEGPPAAAGENNIILGNYIGINAGGTALLPIEGRRGAGVDMASVRKNMVLGNVIGGFDLGVIIGGGSSENTVQGNFIGTNAAGTAALPNRNGITISTGLNSTDPITTNNLIGGTTPGAGNVISGNASSGIFLAGSRNTIQGNFVGVAGDGSTPMPNGDGGITSSAGGPSDSGNGNLIGGTISGAGNVIAYNGVADKAHAYGVKINSGKDNAILGNSIFGNYGLGIDLGSTFGPTPNDFMDGDTGANNLQNFPDVSLVSHAAGNTTIVSALDSVANTTYRIEFFAGSGYGEGQTFLGATNVTTDGNGHASIDYVVPQIAADQRITMTATDPNGNTSEFGSAAGQLLNISTRSRVEGGEKVLIGGFIVSGANPKKVIIRGIGPSLAAYGVPGAMANPILELRDDTGSLATNDNWKSAQRAEIEATGIPPVNDLEAAIVRTLPANDAHYTAILRDNNDTPGIGVVELYDLDATADSAFANISTRGLVKTNNDILIGGFIAGRGLTKVILRAIGPSLVTAGVADPLQDPRLQLFNASGTAIATNDDWKTTQRLEIEASGLPPNDDRESAVIASLPPGNYTAVVRGKNNETGIAVVEVYNLQ